MKKKITILALHLGFGGVEKYISSLCKMLQDDYDIEIISTYDNGNGPAFYFDENVKISYLINHVPPKEKLKSAVRNINFFQAIKYSFDCAVILIKKYYKNIAAIKKINSDIIITTRTFHNSLVSRYASKNILKIATEHNFHNNNQKYISNLIKSLKNFDYLILVSKELQKYYSKLLPNVKCVYIPNVIDKNPIIKSSLTSNNLISVGRFEPEKAQLDLLDVFYKVKNELPNIKLFLIGDGSLRNQIKEKINFLGLDDSVILTGFISQNEMEKYYLESSMFVLTSLTESFGLVLIEAMSYGVPCIAFDCASGAREVLENGILISNRNKDLMADKIIKYLKSKNKRKNQEDALIISKKYFIEEIRKRWISLLNK